MLSYREGDLFARIKGLGRVVIPHVCNNVGAWGAGFVVPLGKAFPKARKDYLEWHRDRQTSCHTAFVLGSTQFVTVDDENLVVVANMIGQGRIGRGRPPRYNALVHCMEDVADFVLSEDVGPSSYEIHCPLFGSGLAGGDWSFIRELIEDCWVRLGIGVTAYYLPGQLPEGVVL